MSNPLIPTCEDLASNHIRDDFDDMINPPGLTNHWATAQVDHDVLAVRSLNVPPVSQGDSISGQLFIDGRLARSFGEPVYTQWRPDRVERVTTINQWRIETHTFCPPGEPGVAVLIRVTNLGARRPLRLGAWLGSTITCSDTPWLSAEPPQNENLNSRSGMRVTSTDQSAWAVQELLAPDKAREIKGNAQVVEAEVELGGGQTSHWTYIHTVAQDELTAANATDRIIRNRFEIGAASRAYWDKAIAAMFDPDNDEFSGH